MHYSPRERQVITEGNPVTLKPKEAQLLEYFFAHAGRVISSEELTQNIWAYEAIPTDATIRSHIRNLRSIIGTAKITTLRGLGYRYDEA